jgi:hypothetical protein
MTSKTSKPAADIPPVAAPQQAPEKPVLFTLQAVHDTWLKKSTDAAADLPDNEKVLVPAGKRLPVLEMLEIPVTAHELV